MLQYFVLCLSIFVSVHCQLNEKSRENIKQMFGKCLEEFNMTPDDFVKIRDMDMDPCFMACHFKETKFMDDKGMLNIEGIKNMSKSMSPEHQDTLLSKVPESCKEVNEKEVSDGEKGCERAKLIAECISETSKKMRLERHQKKD